MERRFTSREVATLTGMTPRQLQWWDERGIVVPAREGRRRTYSFDDLAEVAVIGELRARGFSLQRVRKMMRFLQREFGRRLVETVAGGSDYHLLTDSSHAYLETSPQQVIEILKNARQPMFAICLSDTVRRVRAEVGGRDMVPPAPQAQPGPPAAGAGEPAQPGPERSVRHGTRQPVEKALSRQRQQGREIA